MTALSGVSAEAMAKFDERLSDTAIEGASAMGTATQVGGRSNSLRFAKDSAGWRLTF
jgi:hypothetical protein